MLTHAKKKKSYMRHFGSNVNAGMPVKQDPREWTGICSSFKAVPFLVVAE